MGTSGFDAAVDARESDHLNRWPFAREIYGIATTGPREWSVRIGIYGQWGTGKTSVLNFVRVLAQGDGHVLISFNPWRFASATDLWKEFVRTIFEQLEKALGTPLPGAGGKKVKRLAGAAAAAIPKFIGLWRAGAAEAADAGLSYLKRFVTFGPNDLVELEKSLEGRRILVLIDDLDRTDPKLVPEVLFALKEIMDVPGMAFICAFDPQVVGEVLGQFHPGFGDGLKFLEKIIDYPRWLSEPTLTQLAKLAMSDAARHCPYVPCPAIEHAVQLLPKNPRNVRQFVRLLTLLKPQIGRHLEREINWPILLSANALKVRFPDAAPTLLRDQHFWYSLKQSVWDTDKGEIERKRMIKERVERIASVHEFSSQTKAELAVGIWGIADKLGGGFGISNETVMYQFHLAEEPCAVTWKEFEAFIGQAADKLRTSASIKKWIEEQANITGQSEDQVFIELFRAAMEGRLNALGRAAEARAESEARRNFDLAKVMGNVLRVLILELGRIETEAPRLSAEDIKKLVESFSFYSSWRTGARHAEARELEERLLLQMAQAWGPEILGLVDGVGLNQWEGDHDVHDAKWQEVIEKMRGLIRPKLASWMAKKFRHDPEFGPIVLHGNELRHRCEGIFLARNGPLWKDQQQEIFAVLAGAESNAIVRGNTFYVLQWFDYLLRKPDSQIEELTDLLSDIEVVENLWRAVFSEPLSASAVNKLATIFGRCKNSGAKLTMPPWWTGAISQLEYQSSKRQSPVAPESDINIG